MSEFGDAFKTARSSGKKTFMFKGKSYHTRTKEDEARAATKNTAAKKPAPKVNHMAGVGVAPARMNNAKLRGATVTAKRKTTAAPASGAKVNPGKIASSMLRKGAMPGRRRGR